MLDLPVNPARVLVVRLSHLGDVVTTLPLLHAVARRWPEAEIAWAVESAFAPLLEGVPGLQRVIAHDRGAGLRAALTFRRELRRFDADLVIDAQGNGKSAAWTRLAGGRSAGFAQADWQEPWAARFLQRHAPPVGRERHAVERALGLAHFVTGEEAEARFALGLEGPGRWPELGGPDAVLLHLSPADDVRGWPTEHWIQLGARLLAEGLRVVLLAGPNEAAVAERVGDALPDAARWFGAKPLREFAATLAAAALDGATFLGVDSGPTHLAAAVGLSPFSLHGPTDAARTGPWPPSPARQMRLAEPLDCAPCFSRRCSHTNGPVCLSNLSPERVAAALAR